MMIEQSRNSKAWAVNSFDIRQTWMGLVLDPSFSLKDVSDCRFCSWRGQLQLNEAINQLLLLWKRNPLALGSARAGKKVWGWRARVSHTCAKSQTPACKSPGFSSLCLYSAVENGYRNLWLMELLCMGTVCQYGSVLYVKWEVGQCLDSTCSCVHSGVEACLHYLMQELYQEPNVGLVSYPADLRPCLGSICNLGVVGSRP